MSPTLTLSVPFILLGRRDVYDPANTTTEPITMILQTLQTYCPNIPVVPWALHTSPHLLSAAAQAYLDLRKSATWILRPAPCSTPFLSAHDTPRGWRATDARLTPAEEKTLGDNTWACPVVLQRLGVPLETTRRGWHRFVRETHQLLGVLRKAFVLFHGTVRSVRGPARYWDLGAGERCVLKVDVVCEREACATRVCMLLAAFERELDMLRTVGEVVAFAGVSRWLQGVLLARLAREKRDVWRGLGSGAGEEERYRRTVGREREWWDVVCGMDEAEILDAVRRVEACGMRLGVGMSIDEEGKTRVVMQGQRSTLDASYLVAYTELLARIVDTAHRSETDELAALLEDFQLLRSDEPLDRFSSMLDFLAQPGTQFHPTSKATLLAHLSPFTKSANPPQPASRLPPPRPTRPRQAVDPFYKLRTHIESTHAASRKDMVQFVERYDRAGGYMPTRQEKLCAMLSAEEERQRKVRGGQQKVLPAARIRPSMQSDGLRQCSEDEDERAVEERATGARDERVGEWLKAVS